MQFKNEDIAVQSFLKKKKKKERRLTQNRKVVKAVQHNFDVNLKKITNKEFSLKYLIQMYGETIFQAFKRNQIYTQE